MAINLHYDHNSDPSELMSDWTATDRVIHPAVTKIAEDASVFVKRCWETEEATNGVGKQADPLAAFQRQ